jgi:acyl dehydratase
MPLNEAFCRDLRFPTVEENLVERDCLLYALSLGLGDDPVDGWALQYVFEQNLRPFPTQAVTLGHPGNWMTQQTGITRSRVLHGGQKLRILNPLRPNSRISAANKIVEIADKGEGRGAVIVKERRLVDADGTPLAEMEWTIFCRGDGGFGGSGRIERGFSPVPARDPDFTVSFATQPNAALLYRLNGDRNPIHADPVAARAAGFARPILHGLCLYGRAAAWFMRRYGAQLSVIEARFSSPSLPGEALTLRGWDLSTHLAFEIVASDRSKAVLEHGRIDLR